MYFLYTSLGAPAHAAKFLAPVILSGMAAKVHMVIGTAAASKGTKYPPNSRHPFIFLYLTDSVEGIFAEAIRFLTENH
jgi:hypothetical protein